MVGVFSRTHTPKQAIWLDSLSIQDNLTLLASMKEDFWENLDEGLPALITEAVNLGLTANLSLEGVVFENQDL